MNDGRPAAPAPVPLSRVRRSLDRLRERLWFWPVVAAVLAAGAAETLVRFDRALDERNARPIWVFSGEAGAARDVLSAIASASMTVIGVTLSITLAVLALTGQGYSPRTIRRFIRDPLVQAVIAGFVGTFVFALVALRLVRTQQVPGVTVNVSVVLAMGAIALLIAFFHHMANEIRVERLIDAVWKEAREVIASLAARTSGDDPTEPQGTPAALGRATRSGRVQTIADERLAGLARDARATIVVVPGPGDFVIEGEVVVRVHGDPASASEAAPPAVEAIELGVQRRMTQDVAFGIDQLTDIALRALSPGINDPTTAEEALLRSADLLCRLADRQLATRVVEDGRVLMLRCRPSWEDLVGAAFDQVAAEAEAHADAATSLVLIDALGRIVAAVDDPARVEALRARVRRVRDGARRAIPERTELERVEAAAAALA
jgi:uncharacterized membrane protein